MKTSLNIDDAVFKAAQRETLKNKRTLSEIISEWARLGRYAVLKRKNKPSKIKTVNLGGPARFDLNSRRNWMDFLDE